MLVIALLSMRSSRILLREGFDRPLVRFEREVDRRTALFKARVTVWVTGPCLIVGGLVAIGIGLDRLLR
jgi:hypothetical protein